MMGTIYHCLTVDNRYTPPRRTLAYEAQTEAEAIRYLQEHGGGVYRNLLHNFECAISAKKGAI